MVYLRVIVQKIHYRFQNGGGSFGHWKAEGSGIKSGDAQVMFTVLQGPGELRDIPAGQIL